MKIYENTRESMKSMQIHENLKNIMKVIRWQEASLESSKGVYKGNKSNHTILSTHAPKSMKINKSMQIYENLKNTMKVLK